MNNGKKITQLIDSKKISYNEIPAIQMMSDLLLHIFFLEEQLRGIANAFSEMHMDFDELRKLSYDQFNDISASLREYDLGIADNVEVVSEIDKLIDTLKQMQKHFPVPAGKRKIVINDCYGGFSLSRQSCSEFK